jgi:hypothetical protein
MQCGSAQESGEVSDGGVEALSSLLLLFRKNKVVDWQNKVVDSISLVRETTELLAVDVK